MPVWTEIRERDREERIDRGDVCPTTTVSIHPHVCLCPPPLHSLRRREKQMSCFYAVTCLSTQPCLPSPTSSFLSRIVVTGVQEMCRWECQGKIRSRQNRRQKVGTQGRGRWEGGREGNGGGKNRGGGHELLLLWGQRKVGGGREGVVRSGEEGGRKGW